MPEGGSRNDPDRHEVERLRFLREELRRYNRGDDKDDVNQHGADEVSPPVPGDPDLASCEQLIEAIHAGS